MQRRNYLNLCFTKIKRPIATQSAPKSPPSQADRSRPFSSAATFIKNYNSLFAADDPEPHIAAAFTSHRFFFSSPGRSNSIIESTTSPSSSASTSTATSDSGDCLFNNSMAIPAYSPDPYAYFRQSMQEMVEARQQMDLSKSSSEFLLELLLCYLALNPKSTHKYILGAFADLTSQTKPPPPLMAAEDGGGDGECDEISCQDNGRDN